MASLELGGAAARPLPSGSLTTPLSPPSLRPSRRVTGPPPLGCGSDRMAAATPTQTPAPEASGLGMDARLDQETAQWLRWDRVRADLRLLGSLEL